MKKISLIPVLVLMLTMMFSTLTWGGEFYSRVEITIPTEAGKTVGEVRDALSAKAGVDTSEAATDDLQIGGIGPGGFVIRETSDTSSSGLADDAQLVKGKTYYLSVSLQTIYSGVQYSQNSGHFSGDLYFKGEKKEGVDTSVTSAMYTNNLLNIKSLPFTVTGSSTPDPAPDPAPKKDVEEEKPFVFFRLPEMEKVSTKNKKEVEVDLDTFKSEAPAKTCYTLFEDRFTDLKIHSVVDNKTKMNQRFLMAVLIGPDAKEKLTTSIYAPMAGAGAADGQKQILIWKDYTGTGVKGQQVDAVVYNQTDGAYVIHGVYKDSVVIEFYDYIFRDASTITITER